MINTAEFFYYDGNVCLRKKTGGSDRTYLAFPVKPSIYDRNGKQYALECTSSEKTSAGLTLRFGGDAIGATVDVKISDGGATYSCTLSGNGQISRIVYGGGPIRCIEPDGVVCELYTWCPDLYNSLVPKKGRISLALSSLELRDENSFAKGDGGRFIIPPYVCAVRLAEDLVLGAGTTDIPDSMQGLQPVIQDRDLSFVFDYRDALEVSGNYAAPSLRLYATESYDDVMDRYRDALLSERPEKIPVNWEKQWGLPIYCTIGDQAYHSMIESGSTKEADFDDIIDHGFMERMMKIARDKDLAFGNVIFDAGWMKHVGYWDVEEKRFPDLAGYISELRSRGIRSILWYTPYDTQFNGRCDFFDREHPEYRVRDGEGKLLDILDYTNPEVRDFVASRLRYLLSDEKGCLGADGLKVDFYYHLYNEKGLRFFDPSYGTGERLQYKTLRFIYETAKKIKPTAFIEGSSANPLFNDTQDACRLNDDVTGNAETYRRRARITAVSGCNVPDTDDWWSYKDYFVRLTMQKCAFGIPAVYAIRYRGEQGHMLFGYRSVAPGGNPVPIEEHEYRALSAVLRVYGNSPIDCFQRRTVDPKENFYARYYTDGELKDFYAAVCLNESTALATYNPECVAVCSLRNAKIRLPLPKGYRAVNIKGVFRGGETDRSFETADGNVVFLAENCGERSTVYRVALEKAKENR